MRLSHRKNLDFSFKRQLLPNQSGGTMEPREPKEADESDGIKALTMAELATLRRFIPTLELEFQGGDLLLWARYQEPKDEGSTDSFTGEPIAKIGIREVAAASVGNLSSRLDGNDSEGKRNELFIFAGRLREAARLIEIEATLLSERDWNTSVLAEFEEM
jgi:hypothetical protein